MCQFWSFFRWFSRVAFQFSYFREPKQNFYQQIIALTFCISCSMSNIIKLNVKSVRSCSQSRIETSASSCSIYIQRKCSSMSETSLTFFDFSDRAFHSWADDSWAQADKLTNYLFSTWLCCTFWARWGRSVDHFSISLQPFIYGERRAFNDARMFQFMRVNIFIILDPSSCNM